jgi:hypothetical protein
VETRNEGFSREKERNWREGREEGGNMSDKIGKKISRMGGKRGKGNRETVIYKYEALSKTQRTS